LARLLGKINKEAYQLMVI